MDAEVVMRYRIPDVCDAEQLGDFGTFDELVRWMIVEEGIHGLAEDEPEIVSIQEIQSRSRYGSTPSQ